MNALRKPFLWLAPEETPEERVLPLTLLVRPAPVLALVVLGLNDHWWKGSGLMPAWLTGKISDFAGLLYFPLLLVTLVNLVLLPLERGLGRSVPGASPTTAQITAASAATAAFFAGVQLVPAVADLYARATAVLSVWSDAPRAQVTMDPTDVVAVPMCLLAWWLGRRAVARVPPGRIDRMKRAGTLPEDPAAAAAMAGVGDVWRALPKTRRPLLSRCVEAAGEGDELALAAGLQALRAEPIATDPS